MTVTSVTVRGTIDPCRVQVEAITSDGRRRGGRGRRCRLPPGQHTLAISQSGEVGVDLADPAWSTAVTIPADMTAVDASVVPILVSS